MTMIVVHPEPVTHFRLFLALSAIAHLLALAWNTPSLMLPGHADAVLSVTLGEQRAVATTPPGRQNASPSHVTTSQKMIDGENPAFSRAETPVTETSTAQESLRTAPEVDDDQEATRAYLRSRLLANLANYFYYPALARRNGWEGTVLLGLRVEPDGQLDKIRLERSSGYAVLDNSALNSLKRIGNLVEARAWLEGHSVDMQLPVIYRLIEN
jgi:protein TonB